MSFSFLSPRITVPTSAIEIVSFYPKDISSLILYANGDIFIGSGGVSTDNGHKITSGGTFSISHLDFSPDVLKENTLIKIYAVATVETTVNVTTIRR